uniref:Amaranthin-like lectin n=1 Tax=Linum usitatissimum TaxID=4006 RepID=A0A097PID0_LINUS|nr:amaranthin-like lectin [Linum usitatissimum]
MMTVTKLPKDMVLKFKFSGNYIHYLWNDEFGNYCKYMGAKRDLDPVNPFVHVEVVPSTSDPTLVHLRCSYNNKFNELISSSVSWLSATTNSPNEDRTKKTFTLFKPIFPASQPHTVGFLHMQTNHQVRTFFNKDYGDSINMVCAKSNDNGMQLFEFPVWVQYEDVIKLKDREIKTKDEEIKAMDGEIKAKDEEI